MKILRVTPDYFDVVYVINPHMQIGSVDKAKARQQWENLGRIYEEWGAEIFEIPGVEGLPDMVFSANQSLPFKKADGARAVVLSNMFAAERRPELQYFEKWYGAQGYEIYHVDPALNFEGMGDVVYSADRRFLWAGYGYRTKVEAHLELEKITGIPVKSLQLLDPAFYHLDVCLCVLNSDSVLVYPPAFDAESYRKICDEYPNRIEVTKEEAYRFACNAHCPDQKHVILPSGLPRLELLLKKNGFEVVSADTSEFIKSGGSVFCLKLDLE